MGNIPSTFFFRVALVLEVVFFCFDGRLAFIFLLAIEDL
jgi:hypothetical protein